MFDREDSKKRKLLTMGREIELEKKLEMLGRKLEILDLSEKKSPVAIFKSPRIGSSHSVLVIFSPVGQNHICFIYLFF